jgi:hypothetical protein
MTKKRPRPKRPPTVSDHRWVVALDAAEQGNFRELVRALLLVAAIPEWVRRDLRKSKLVPDERPLTSNHKRLLQARSEYRKLGRKPPGQVDAEIEQLATKHNVSSKMLWLLVSGKGEIYELIGHRRAPPAPGQ